MIPLCVPNLSGNEARYLAQCIETTFVSSVGAFVTRFEQMVAEASGAGHAAATASGTTALHAALLTVGVRPGDLVICPSLTFIASANAISHCGATPWLFDIDRETWTLDPKRVADRLASETGLVDGVRRHTATGRRVSALLPVFTLGVPANMERLVPIAKENGLAVVVDGAAALGARYRGRLSGDLGADLTMYSFNGNKTVTAGGGGAVAGTDAALVKAFRHLTTTARVGAEYDHDMVGYNYRMTNLQAAVGCAQMEQLDRFVAAKRRISAAYDDAFGSIRGLGCFPEPEWAESPAWFSGVVMEMDDGAARSADLRSTLRAAGIDARPFWRPMHQQAPYRDAPRTAMPVSDDLWQRIVTLPCSTGITDAELSTVIDAVVGWSRAAAA